MADFLNEKSIYAIKECIEEVRKAQRVFFERMLVIKEKGADEEEFFWACLNLVINMCEPFFHSLSPMNFQSSISMLVFGLVKCVEGNEDYSREFLKDIIGKFCDHSLLDDEALNPVIEKLNENLKNH